MTDYILNKYGRKIFQSQAQAFEPLDPYIETYLDPKGKSRTRKRPMIEGLTKHEVKVLKSVRRRAHYLDKGFNVFGFKFGWSAILGLIPFFGDIAAFVLAYFLVLNKIREIDNLPLVLQQRMFLNITIAAGAGAIPLVGDIILAIYKANSRNAALLEEYLIARVASRNSGSSTGGSAAIDRDLAARQALNSPGIDSSGERIGSQGVLVEEGVSGTKGSGKKSWLGNYGWNKDPNEEVISGTGTSQLRQPVGSSSGVQARNTGI